MGNYWTDVKRTFIVVSVFFNWAQYLLLFEMVRSRLVTDLQETLVLMWVLAALGALRVVLYLSIPREERDIYEFRRPFRLFVEAYIVDLDSTWDRLHNLITFFVHPYTETGLFVYIIVRFLLALKRLH